MTPEQKIEKLKAILNNQIKWYETKMAEHGEEYVYDELYDQFNNLSRSDFMNIIDILIEE